MPEALEDIVIRLRTRAEIRRRVRAEGIARDMDEAADEIERLRLCLNPREWTKEMHDAWHKSLPDTEKAFSTLSQETHKQDELLPCPCCEITFSIYADSEEDVFAKMNTRPTPEEAE